MISSRDRALRIVRPEREPESTRTPAHASAGSPIARAPAAHRRPLVLGRADQRIADIVRQPVHLRLGKVERHPDEPGEDTVPRPARARRQVAAPRQEPHTSLRRPTPSDDASLGRCQRDRFALLVGDPVLAIRTVAARHLVRLRSCSADRRPHAPAGARRRRRRRPRSATARRRGRHAGYLATRHRGPSAARSPTPRRGQSSPPPPSRSMRRLHVRSTRGERTIAGARLLPRAARDGPRRRTSS